MTVEDLLICVHLDQTSFDIQSLMHEHVIRKHVMYVTVMTHHRSMQKNLKILDTSSLCLVYNRIQSTQ